MLGPPEDGVLALHNVDFRYTQRESLVLGDMSMKVGIPERRHNCADIGLDRAWLILCGGRSKWLRQEHNHIPSRALL